MEKYIIESYRTKKYEWGKGLVEGYLTSNGIRPMPEFYDSELLARVAIERADENEYKDVFFKIQKVYTK